MRSPRQVQRRVQAEAAGAGERGSRRRGEWRGSYDAASLLEEVTVSMSACSHLDQIEFLELPERIEGCAECLASGGSWVHLRMCQSCGRQRSKSSQAVRVGRASSE